MADGRVMSSNAGRFWADYEYITGRHRPVAVKHCQAHHDEVVSRRRPDADRPGYSVRLRPSEDATCMTCGAAQKVALTSRSPARRTGRARLRGVSEMPGTQAIRTRELTSGPAWDAP